MFKAVEDKTLKIKTYENNGFKPTILVSCFFVHSAFIRVESVVNPWPNSLLWFILAASPR